jgi:heme/copper-type cytochrome/quinol oxidase subunit 3
MRLFLLSLFMLFAAAMVGYVAIRLAGSKSPQHGTLHFPEILWLSTAIVITISFTMSRAVHALRLERQRAFLNWLRISLALAVGFLLVQTPAMARLLADHERMRTQGSGLFLYGLVFFLILLHALHVLGGMVALVRVTFRARQGAYDHENIPPVRHTAMYWHFLDMIWIVMFLTFLFTA